MFLPKVLDQTIEAESPRQFFFWAALTAVSAVLKRNVCLDRHLFKVYPNIYVFLVAKSGLRKGLPPAMATKLVTAVNNTRVIEGRSSIQALIKELSDAWIPEGANKPVTDACGFIVSPELAAAMVEDPQATTIMTDLYDSQYHNKWKNRLKGSGLEVLEYPTITWLAASNEELLKSVITQRELHGGFVGRTFLVTASKKNRVNSLVDKPAKVLDYDDLTKDLRAISQLKGEFILTDQAKIEFDKWYQLANSQDHEDTTGSYERLDSHILKVSMLLQAGRTCSLEITAETIQEAIELCAPMVRSANRTAEGQGQNPLAGVALKFIQILAIKGKFGRMEILRQLWKDISANELDQIVDTLQQAGAIHTINQGGKVLYDLTDKMKISLRANANDS